MGDIHAYIKKLLLMFVPTVYCSVIDCLKLYILWYDILKVHSLVFSLHLHSVSFLLLLPCANSLTLIYDMFLQMRWLCQGMEAPNDPEGTKYPNNCFEKVSGWPHFLFVYISSLAYKLSFIDN